MNVKALELRDAGTFIPILCIDMNDPVNEGQHYLLRRCGYSLDGRPNVIITRLDGNGRHAFNDPYAHSDRTWHVAHNWIIEHWSELSDGDVVCVEHILGERSTPKVSERFTAPMGGA
jgi:hypothetical protein